MKERKITITIPVNQKDEDAMRVDYQNVNGFEAIGILKVLMSLLIKKTTEK